MPVRLDRPGERHHRRELHRRTDQSRPDDLRVFPYGGTQQAAGGILVLAGKSGSEQIPFTVSSGGTPCACLGVTARILPKSIRVLSGHVKFKLRWNLTCSAGSGGGCDGTISVDAAADPGVIDHLVANPYNLSCPGKCGGVHSGTKVITLTGDFTRHSLARKHVSIQLVRHCGTTQLPTKSLSIAFDRVGLPSTRKSKLG